MVYGTKRTDTFVQMTSFGCGPDAFFIDEIRDLLLRNNRSYTLLKLDDINNIGSMKLRVRSLIESLRMSKKKKNREIKPSSFHTTPIYDEKFRNKKIIIPFFTSYISPLIPVAFSNIGYKVHNLPLSAQFGEGWLLPAEIVLYINCGVNNVVCLQPFGCIANHIISKGIEKKLKNIYPNINFLSLDFDSGVSDVNIKNRLLLFIDKII